MRLIIGIVVFVPCAVILGVFAVENRAPLTLNIWPLAGTFEMWASVWVLALLGIGIIVGLGIGWFSTMSWRRRAWKAERLNRTLERKLDERAELPPEVPGRVTGGALPAPASRPARTALIDD